MVTNNTHTHAHTRIQLHGHRTLSLHPCVLSQIMLCVCLCPWVFACSAATRATAVVPCCQSRCSPTRSGWRRAERPSGPRTPSSSCGPPRRQNSHSCWQTSANKHTISLKPVYVEADRHTYACLCGGGRRRRESVVPFKCQAIKHEMREPSVSVRNGATLPKLH